MKNLIATLTTAAILGSGCAASNSSSFPEGHVTGYDFAEKSQSDNPYKLERVILYGDEFHVQVAEPRENTLDFEFLPFDKITRKIDLDSGKITLNSDTRYVPVKVEGDYEEDKWADRMKLRVSASDKTGVRGVSAEIEKIDPQAEYGYSVVKTQEGAQYVIKTMEIRGKRYFFPHVSDKETDAERKLNFYLIPVDGAKLYIDNSDGSITIENENQVYRGMLVEDIPEPEPEPKGPSPGQEEVEGSN